MRRRMRIARLVAVLAVALSAGTAEAQGGPDARMREFLRAARRSGTDALAPFFPARGTFDWVPTTDPGSASSVTGRWRFAGVDLERATDYSTGPLCESFSPGGDVVILGTLMTAILGRDEERETGEEWRRVGATRFVPPGAPASSPVFVEWRREDGRWVVAAFGDERGLRVLGGMGGPNVLVRDSVRGAPLELPLPADAIYPSGMRWFEENQPIVVDYDRFLKYGDPRPMEPGSLRRIGTVQGVGVYVEPMVRGRPEVIFVPLAPGGPFQPFQDMLGSGCAKGP